MRATPQKRALKRYRQGLAQRGMARFEVLGRDADRELIRMIARRLAGNDPDSTHLRTAVYAAVSGNSTAQGGILKALRRSPLVGADLDLKRAPASGREVDL